LLSGGPAGPTGYVLPISKGETSVHVEFPTKDNFTPDDGYVLDLAITGGSKLGPKGPFDSASTEILDDDGGIAVESFSGPTGPIIPVVSITGGGILTEGTTLGAAFAIHRSPAIGSLTVQIQVHPDSTASPSDWESAYLASGSVTFDSGQSSVSIPLTAIDDTLLEGRETLIVNIIPSPSSDYIISVGTTAREIHDGDHGIFHTGFGAQWEDELGQWQSIPGQIIWQGVDHRWLPEIPSQLIGEISTVEFYRRSHDNPAESWELFASESFGVDAIEYIVYGNPGEGNWDIMFIARYSGYSWFQSTPARNAGIRIASVKWEGYDAYMDGETNLDTLQGKLRFFPERNAPTPSAGYEIHNKVYVEVSLGSPLPGGIDNADVSLKLFDPDFLTNGGVAASDEHLIDDNGLLGEDNLGEGILVPDSIHFGEGDVTKRVVFMTSCAQPGDNYRVVAWPALWPINKLNLGGDGQTIQRPTPSGTTPLEPNYQTKLLTIWRTLNVELDSLGPPPEGEMFDGAGVGNDDVAVLNLDAPPIYHMQAEYPKAFVQLKTLSNSYDVTDDARFDHNSDDFEAFSVGDSVRDVRSEEAFWVVQMFGAYEGPDTKDNDDEFDVRLGTAPGTDGPCNVYFEAIRDNRAFLVDNVPEATFASETTAVARVALHESLHRFGLYHPDPAANQGAMGPYEFSTGVEGQRHRLSPQQIRAIIARLYPH
jgi:hypothetical protein